MKKIIVIICSLFLSSCVISNATTHKITVTPKTDYWKITVKGSANIWATPYEDLQNTSIQTTISIDLTTALIALDSPNCEANTKSLDYDSVTLSFGTLSEGKYEFYNGSFNLISQGKNYTLKPIDGKQINTTFDITPKKNNKGAYYWPNRSFRYSLPLMCSKLDNAIVNISGIYKNGKELPPIKFKINLLNRTEIKS